MAALSVERGREGKINAQTFHSGVLFEALTQFVVGGYPSGYKQAGGIAGARRSQSFSHQIFDKAR